MSCFNGIRRRMQCMVNDLGDSEIIIPTPTGSVPESYDPNAYIKRRRFGIDSFGVDILKDAFGEPLNITGEVYQDIVYPVYMKKSKNMNDENSTMGGINDYGVKKQLEIIVPVSSSIMKNDLIEFPLNSNDWYRVHQIDNTKVLYKSIFATSEVRSTI